MRHTDISTTVTSSVARELLDRAGVVRDERGRWLFPDARCTWATDEALAWALPLIAGADHRTRPALARRIASRLAAALRWLSLPLLALALMLAPLIVPPTTYYPVAVLLLITYARPDSGPLRDIASWLRPDAAWAGSVGGAVWSVAGRLAGRLRRAVPIETAVGSPRGAIPTSRWLTGQ